MELPIELWRHIFSHLSPVVLHKTVSLVCKDWLKMVRDDVKHFKLHKKFILKLFKVTRLQSVSVSEDKLNLVMARYLNAWPRLEVIEMDWVWKMQDEDKFQDQKDLFKFTLDYFKRSWNLPFIKSIIINEITVRDYTLSKGICCEGIVYKSDSVDLKKIVIDLERVKLAINSDWFSTKIGKVETFCASQCMCMDYIDEDDFPREAIVLKEFLTAQVGSIKTLKLYDVADDITLEPVLKPLAKSHNTTLQNILISYEEGAIEHNSDFELLKKLTNLKSITIFKAEPFRDLFSLQPPLRQDIPYIQPYENSLTYLRITKAALGGDDLNLIADYCRSLEVLRIEGADDGPYCYTQLNIGHVASLISTFYSRNCIKEVRITNIVTYPWHPDCEERCLDCSRCQEHRDDFKKNVEDELVQTITNNYTSSTFIFIMFLNINHLPTIGYDNIDYTDSKYAALLVVKDRDKDVKVEHTQYNLDFEEYFEYKNGDFLLKDLCE